MLVRFAHNTKILFLHLALRATATAQEEPGGALNRVAYARRLIGPEQSDRCVTFCGEDEIKDDRVQNLVRDKIRAPRFSSSTFAALKRSCALESIACLRQSNR
jgi:hypothetical protein